MEDKIEDFGFEIDFLPVGDKSRSGDAICIRWGYRLADPASRKQYVCVVDGGFKENGAGVVDHLVGYYGTKHIDVLVNTHPHGDHVGGLPVVLEKCTVDYLLIHKPWEHSDLKESFHDGRVTNKGIKEDLRNNLETAYSLVKAASENKHTKCCECFAPCSWTNAGVTVYVLGPTKGYYDKQLPNFVSTPTDAEEDGVRLKYDEDAEMVPADKCPLSDEGATSAENNSGIILLFKLPGGELVLLTGDAGMPALEQAVAAAKSKGLDLPSNIVFFQVPHHGSIQNVGPTILKKIFGDASRRDTSPVAYISVCKEPDSGHPSKQVVNDLASRNVRCFPTQGVSIYRKFGNVPSRDGWTAIEAIGPFSKVEPVHV